MEKQNDDSTTNQTPPNDTRSNEPVTPPKAKLKEFEEPEEVDKEENTGNKDSPFMTIVTSYKLENQLEQLKAIEDSEADIDGLIDEFYKTDKEPDTNGKVNGTDKEESILNRFTALKIYGEIQDDYDKLNEKHKKRHISFDLTKGDALNIT